MDKDDQIVILEINWMFGAYDICNCFDHTIPVEFIVAPYCRPNSILFRIDEYQHTNSDNASNAAQENAKTHLLRRSSGVKVRLQNLFCERF